MSRFATATPALVAVCFVVLCGCGELAPRGRSEILIPGVQRAEIVGVIADLGTPA
jgi:hypothetical protein